MRAAFYYFLFTGLYSMRIKLLVASIAIAISNTNPVFAADDIKLLQQQLEKLKQNYDQRIQALEARLKKAETHAEQASTQASQLTHKAGQVETPSATSNAQNSLNPAISLILDGRYASFKQQPDKYELPGFALGNEAGVGEEGISLGHTELTVSANIDDKFYGETTLAIHEHEGSTELELEEAFVQTLGLGNGLGVKAGRFFSAVGYLNEQHEHIWDFADAPLIYRGLFGNQLRDDGLQISYIAPTDTFLQLGAEAFRGSRFPAGGEHGGVGAWTAFAHLGGDIGVEHSWLLGLSHWQANDIDGRTSGGHSHDGEAVEIPSFTGKSKINALDLVYKWSPNGNSKNQNFKLQFEYFDRREDGVVTLLNSDPLETTHYDGHQKGWYAQAVYQFMPQWRTGLRYDQLGSSNSASDDELLGEAGLDNEGHTPRRYSVMLEWLPSEFSRIRLQFNQDKSYENTDKQLFLQYTHSLGSHGAHTF
ncbi:hypothetical protein QUF61_04315 [Candidatus Venteria ishoeyi]|uniref:hypothetical protein n=1 Tax=Candidatus Venteria ishoeyi TaxID=1899563 RepID=UPI0025A61256|nr:hypothetical protein [Candidatus Venteria ishoeyi]MDM8545700.1 hypothetical protein [Candidatus Venteria ishoeyi]